MEHVSTAARYAYFLLAVTGAGSIWALYTGHATVNYTVVASHVTQSGRTTNSTMLAEAPEYPQSGKDRLAELVDGRKPVAAQTAPKTECGILGIYCW